MTEQNMKGLEKMPIGLGLAKAAALAALAFYPNSAPVRATALNVLFGASSVVGAIAIAKSSRQPTRQSLKPKNG